MHKLLVVCFFQMSLVDLGKRLLQASKDGSTDEVRVLMSNGAPFTTDWVAKTLARLFMETEYNGKDVVCKN